MDRRTVYPDELPFDTDILEIERFAYEGLAILARDMIGDTTAVSRLPCTPTAPASMSVKVGAGSIYALGNLEDTDWGGLGGAGGLTADTNADHKVLRQGLHRDTQTFNCPAPVTGGQSIVYLVQAQFQQADDAGVTSQFYNVANPTAPISNTVSPHRLDKCVLALKAGAPAATGTQTAPGADAGWVPVWRITVANGDVSLDATHIARDPGCPLVSALSGGGGGIGLAAWTVVTANHAVVNGERLLCDTSGGAFSLTLPAAPSVGDQVSFKVNGATNNLTFARNGHTIAGAASNLVIDKDNVSGSLVYDGATWRV